MSVEDFVVRLLNRRPTGKLPKQPAGFYLGTSETLVTRERAPFVLPFDPVQHTFISGRSGCGKTTALLRLLYEHIRCAVPFLFIDFHGHATDEILAMLANAPARPVILVEPWADPVIGWNLLAADGESPYPVVQELVAIFHRRLWADAWGPRLEELLRMALLALAEAKLTILEATAFLSRPEFRRAVLRSVSLPEVREFWTLRFERLSPSQRALISESVLNKLSIFQDPSLRHLVGQRHGALDFDQALAEGHIILANLSSGRLRGNNYLLAALLVAAFKNAIYRRPSNARSYSLILDEFQEMLALEILDDFLRSFRKFNCPTYLATQTLTLPPDLKASIFGNCGRFLAFAASATDAAFLGKEFGSADGELAAALLPELKVGHAIVKVRGEPARSLHVSPPPDKATRASAADGRKRSVQAGNSRSDIEQEIARRTGELISPSRKTASQEVPPLTSPDAKSTLPEGYV